MSDKKKRYIKCDKDTANVLAAWGDAILKTYGKIAVNEVLTIDELLAEGFAEEEVPEEGEK